MKINIISKDTFFVERMRIAARKFSHVHILFSPDPIIHEPVDVFIVPFDRIEELPGSRNITSYFFKIISYGHSHHIKTAFLSGADDFIKEPWNLDEAICRAFHITSEKSGEIRLPRGTIQYTSCTLTSGEISSSLRFNEYIILDILVRNMDTVVPREVLFYGIWKTTGKRTRVVDVYISSLRKKLRILSEKNRYTPRITCVRNNGYRLTVTDT